MTMRGVDTQSVGVATGARVRAAPSIALRYTIHCRDMNHPESPAEKVITIFGGVRPLAREIGRNPSSVVRWRRPKEEGGTGGSVPSALQGKLLSLARARGLPLTADDLIQTSR